MLPVLCIDVADNDCSIMLDRSLDASSELHKKLHSICPALAFKTNYKLPFVIFEGPPRKKGRTDF